MISDEVGMLSLPIMPRTHWTLFPFAPDNASDPGVCAKQMWIDVVEEKGQLCLTFTDNGCGMTPNKLHKMLR